MAKTGERKAQILQTLAAMLEDPKGERITTALLAARLEVSEAALYRHFSSKAQMFEGLIEFIEQTVFSLVNRIQAEMSTTNGEGEFGSMESNCDELDVGANTEATRPDEQVIIADKIVNVGGHCRMIRNQGGFKPKGDQPKSTDRVIGKPPARH